MNKSMLLVQGTALMKRRGWQPSRFRNWSFCWKWVITTQQRSRGFLLNSHENGCSSHLWGFDQWSILKDITLYLLPVLQTLLEGGQFTDITRVCSTLKPQLCLQPWKRWWTTLRTLLDRRHWNQTEVENASHCDERDHFRNHLNHPEVTLRPLDATSRNIWIIWAMRCYTSRQGPCQAVPGGMFLLKTPLVQARSPGIHVICSYGDTIWRIGDYVHYVQVHIRWLVGTNVSGQRVTRDNKSVDITVSGLCWGLALNHVALPRA